MTSSYTVEVTTRPVGTEDGWTALTRVIDTVPGTLLVEDPDAPTLIVPVDAATPMDAIRFVDGLARLMGLNLVSGSVYPTPSLDPAYLDGLDESPRAPTDVMNRVAAWVAATPPIRGRVEDDGRLLDA